MPDREDVIARLRKMGTWYKSMMAVGWQGDMEIYQEHRETVHMAIELLKKQPDEHEVCANCPVDKDYAEIVRCKDCKWWDKKSEESNYGYCHACKHGFHSKNWEIGIYRIYNGDFFCADGETEETEEEEEEE